MAENGVVGELPARKRRSSMGRTPVRPLSELPAAPGASSSAAADDAGRWVELSRERDDARRASVTLSHAALDSLPVALYATDSNGLVNFYNEAAARLWGIRPEIGKSRWCGSVRLFRPDGEIWPHESSPLATALRESRALLGVETLAERPDGRRIPINNHVILLKDDSGLVVGALNWLEDLTEHRNALVEAHRLAAIVEGSGDAIMSKTLEGTITSWNAGATRIFGYSAAEMIGQPITRIIPEESRAEEQTIIQALRAGERIDHFDTIRLAKDGRRVPVSLTISPIRDASGDIVGASKIARDATNRKRAEEALRDATEQALQARMEAESANKEKTDFLAVMSHEIRTPMTGIAGFIELLSCSGELTPDQRRYIGLVKAANATLLTVVNDILDFSKVEAGQLELHPQPFDVANLVYESAAITHPAAAEKGLLLRYNVDPNVPEWLLGDDGRLRQILLNLLNNAIKFTAAGSVSVDVQSQTSADGRERILFTVADTGVGIPAQQQCRLFEKFSQGDSSVSRCHGGTGLGLAICKRLVDLMKGEIGVVSEAGRGATVWFTALLPSIAAPSAETPAPAHMDAPARQKGRILLVDDIDANLEIVGHYLRDNGYGVEPCDSAAKAIALLRTTPFDLILMDIQMPVMDGVSATRLIRAMGPPVSEIPVIALTGNVLPQQIRSFLEAGMNDHVSKPIERAHLYNTVGIWLASARGAREAPEVSKLDFNRVKFKEFLANFGSAWVEENASRFLANLEACFKSTPEAARREAHSILNFAGLLGFERLVELCREVENAPADDPVHQLRKFNQLRRAQAKAQQTLREAIIPEARGRYVAGAYTDRNRGKTIAAA